jgi:hypothetical protein
MSIPMLVDFRRLLALYALCSSLLLIVLACLLWRCSHASGVESSPVPIENLLRAARAARWEVAQVAPAREVARRADPNLRREAKAIQEAVGQVPTAVVVGTLAPAPAEGTVPVVSQPTPCEPEQFTVPFYIQRFGQEVVVGARLQRTLQNKIVWDIPLRGDTYRVEESPPPRWRHNTLDVVYTTEDEFEVTYGRMLTRIFGVVGGANSEGVLEAGFRFSW